MIGGVLVMVYRGDAFFGRGKGWSVDMERRLEIGIGGLIFSFILII